MISFDTPSHRFHLRAAALIVRDDRVLLHQAAGDGFWSLPGGRVEAGERAADAVRRELDEELAELVTVGSLTFVVENFFTHEGQRHHEVGLYFAVQLQPGSTLLTSDGPYDGCESDKRLRFDWFARHRLHEVDVRPAFLSAALAQPELQFAHIVHAA